MVNVFLVNIWKGKIRMKRIAKFEKVSFEEFMKAIEDIYSDWDENYIRRVYDDIALPKRATSGSAGYDFFAIEDVTLPAKKLTRAMNTKKYYMKSVYKQQIYVLKIVDVNIFKDYYIVKHI